MKRRFKNIKVRGFKRFESGVFLGEGKNWILLKDNPMDFLVDGYLFVRRRYIVREEHPGSSELTNKIMDLKGEFSKTSALLFDLGRDEVLFDQFLEDKRLIQICLHNQDSTLVGRVVSRGEESFRMKLLSSKGKWLEDFNFYYGKLRTVNVDSDYLRSFELLTRKGS